MQKSKMMNGLVEMTIIKAITKKIKKLNNRITSNKRIWNNEFKMI